MATDLPPYPNKEPGYPISELPPPYSSCSPNPPGPSSDENSSSTLPEISEMTHHNQNKQSPPPSAAAPPPYFATYPASMTYPTYAGGAGFPGGVPDTVVVVGDLPRKEDYKKHIAIACFVFWLCGCFCGLVAFILAIVAHCKSKQNKDEEARVLGKTSLGFSIAGKVTGVVIIIVVLILRMVSYSFY